MLKGREGREVESGKKLTVEEKKDQKKYMR